MSRYPTVKTESYCFHPVHIVKTGVDVFVPCGKCEGCKLHKSNVWSQRVGLELDNNPFSIFFTLTYSNKYLPVLRRYEDLNTGLFYWCSDHLDNIRFDGVRDVLRNDDISFQDFNYPFLKISNSSFTGIPYVSKHDVQLYLKLLRKDLELNLYGTNRISEKSGLFRYFIISEYGPTTYRPHFHGIIFPRNKEVSQYLLDCGLFANWKMCDKGRFSDYAHYCDSGARGYVTQYLTCNSSLPKVYQQVKEIRPFRLSSKAPAIGYVFFDKKEVSEKISNGDLEYCRSIKRLGQSVNVQYPKDYANTIYPKCYRFNQYSFDRILFVYGRLWTDVVRNGYELSFVSQRLSQDLHPMDWQATKACFNLCRLQNIVPFTYCLNLLDYYYYKDMRVLRLFYEGFRDDVLDSWHDYVLLYNNLRDVVNKAFHKIGNFPLVLHYFLEGFGVDVDFDVLLNDSFYVYKVTRLEDYKKEVLSITQNMTKTAKINEKLGIAPTCFTT